MCSGRRNRDVLCMPTGPTSRRRRRHDSVNAAPVRRQPVERDPEVSAIIASIAVRLEKMETLRGPAGDAELFRVEKFAARYVLVLFYELQRLDSSEATPCKTVVVAYDSQRLTE